MERIRKPFQGVSNIIRFNWHFYVLSVALILSLLILKTVSIALNDSYLNILVVLIAVSSILSLLISFYIYDLSNLYTFNWLDFATSTSPQEIVNIHAGFDETSALLQHKFPQANLHVFDFYNPDLHTEISIKRARKAYPSYPKTQSIETKTIPLKDEMADYIFLILAAHEIRNESERVRFFHELNRVLKPSGSIIVVEHLRDGLNFLAYNIGFLHFLPESVWNTTFAKMSLIVHQKIKLARFVTTFILRKDGNSA